MLREIAALGFTHAELSHGIRISLVQGIFEALEAGEIRISSVHNFCPLPMGINHAAPNVFKFTADNPRERARHEVVHEQLDPVPFVAGIEADQQIFGHEEPVEFHGVAEG